MLILTLSAVSFAQSNYTESLTITTYYPAPHGVYNMMRASKMVVGSTGPVEDFADFDGALRFKPVTTPPEAASQPVGTMYFDDTSKTLKYYNGTGDWQPISDKLGSGGNVTYTTVHVTGTSRTLSAGFSSNAEVTKCIGTSVISCDGSLTCECRNTVPIARQEFSSNQVSTPIGSGCTASVNGRIITVSYAPHTCDSHNFQVSSCLCGGNTSPWWYTYGNYVFVSGSATVEILDRNVINIP